MLQELVVQGLGVIERADLSFSPGSTALTGETGAGKTLVVAAVGLLLGGRADRSLVRTGSGQARVEGRFLVERDHPIVTRLRDSDLLDVELIDGETQEQVEIIVARTIGAGGSKARINGRIVTLVLMSEIIGELVEIAGQNEHQRIASAGFQRKLLDAIAGEDAQALAVEVSTMVGQTLSARERADELRAGERIRARELDVLRYEIEEISKAQLSPGEGARLAAETKRLDNAEAIAVGLAAAIEALRDEGGAEDRLGIAEREIRALANDDPDLEGLAGRLEGARLEIADVAAELSGLIVQPDPASLASAHERLDVISRMKRKYGETEEEILSLLQRSIERVGELEGEDGNAGIWERRAEEADRKAHQSAQKLSVLRRKAAEKLQEDLHAGLEDLALAGTRFQVELTERELYEGGIETVTFLVATNAGEALKPIAKVASGGELSRIALALHLADRSASAGTMIFDEVDAGVGGQAARSVGKALADLATTTGSQVIVVTHLPQVAAFADTHLKVSKTTQNEKTAAVVEKVDDDARVEELSRMLAGLPDSVMGREHARELLELAGGGAPAA